MIGMFTAWRRLREQRARLSVAVAEHSTSAKKVESASETLRKRRATQEEKEEALDALVRRMRIHGAAE